MYIKHKSSKLVIARQGLQINTMALLLKKKNSKHKTYYILK